MLTNLRHPDRTGYNGGAQMLCSILAVISSAARGVVAHTHQPLIYTLLDNIEPCFNPGSTLNYFLIFGDIHHNLVALFFNANPLRV